MAEIVNDDDDSVTDIDSDHVRPHPEKEPHTLNNIWEDDKLEKVRTFCDPTDFTT